MRKQVKNRHESENVRRKHALDLIETWLKEHKKPQ